MRPTSQQMIYSRFEKFGLEKMVHPEKPFSEMSTEELRKYVTFFCEIPYCHSGRNLDLADMLPYEKQKEYTDLLNEEFDKRVGNDFVTLYNFFDKKENTEKWHGEKRYQILSFGHKLSQELTQAKKVAALLELGKKLNLNASQLMEILDLVNQWFYTSETDTEEVNSFIDSIL